MRFMFPQLWAFLPSSLIVYMWGFQAPLHIYIYETCETSETIAVFNDLALGFKDITLF